MANKRSPDSRFWWQAKKNQAHEQVFNTAEEIEQCQSTLRDKWEEYAKLYSNRQEMGITWSSEQPTDDFDTLVTYNVVKSAIDTARSIIAKTRVKCLCIWHRRIQSFHRRQKGLPRALSDLRDSRR
jgi:hypothetical protein